MKTIEIVIKGVVQGVFFRAEAKRMAQKLNIKGFVKNESDGSVLIEAEGEKENIKLYIDWCKRGPAKAMVSEIKVKQIETKKYSEFVIL